MDEMTAPSPGDTAARPSKEHGPLIDADTRVLPSGAPDHDLERPADHLADPPVKRPAESDPSHTDRLIEHKVKQRLFTDPPVAERIARFTVLEGIGRGGMGTVYAAYDEQLDRKVAVKVLLGDELPDEEDQARFLREAQALARLSHPHVVTVHEVGQANDQLFLAMEFIRGQNLSQWLHTRSEAGGRGGPNKPDEPCGPDEPREPGGPGWRETLEVFIQAGRGLAAVHHAGLVHRDLKPHNIMRRDDGVVKLLDFGLARAVGDVLDPSLDKDKDHDSLANSHSDLGVGSGPHSGTGAAAGLSSSLTRTGTVLGTPAYMSPEQLHGHVVDARSDQFSFCVALYEAVYGERPYPGTTMDTLLDSMLAGRVRPPPKDRPVPTRLRTMLLRGLAADPAARWSSMEPLLERLQRLLAPRRGRWLALGGGVALGLGLLGLGQTYLAHQADVEQRCTSTRTQLDGIWDDARRQAIEAVITGTKLSFAAGTWARVEPQIDAYADAWTDKYAEVCEATAIRHEQSAEVMRLRMRCLTKHRTSLRASLDVLAEADAAVVKNAVDLVAGLPPLARCDDLEWLEQQDQRMPPPEDPDIAAEVEVLRGQLADVEALDKAGRYAPALQAVEPLVRRAEELGYPPLLAEARYWRGYIRRDNGEYARAEQDLRQAHAQALEHHHDEIVLDTAQVLTVIVGSQLKRYAEGRQWGEMLALPLARRAPDPVELTNSLSALATVFFAQGEYEQSGEYLQRALTILKEERGTEHPSITPCLSNLGITRDVLGDYEEARKHLEHALKIEEKAFGANHPEVAMTLGNLGSVHAKHGEYGEAQRYYERTLAIFEGAIGADHPDTAIILDNLASVYKFQGKYEEARSNHQRALGIFEHTFGRDHPGVATALTNLGDLYSLQEDYENAKRHYERALRIFDGALEPGQADHPDMAISLGSLGTMYRLQGDYESAKGYQEQALEIYEKALGADHPRVAEPLVELSTIALKMDDPESARAHAERAVSIRESAQVAPQYLAEARFVLARALWSTRHERPRARALAEQAKEALATAQSPGPSDRLLTEAEAWLATHHVEGQ